MRIEMVEWAGALVEANRADDPRGRPGLIVASALALESGVPDTAVGGLLSHPNTERPGWLMGAIEGLETLHAQALGLRPHEVSQAVNLALRRQRESADPAGITLQASPAGRRGAGRQEKGGRHRKGGQSAAECRITGVTKT